MRRADFNREEPQQRHEHHRDWLKQIHWSAYAKLGFRRPPSRERAEDLFSKWIAHMKVEEGHQDIQFLKVQETWNWRENPHLHVLLATAKPMKVSTWEQQWFRLAGIAKVDPYDPDQGACNYLARKWVSGVAEVDFSDGFKKLLS